MSHVAAIQMCSSADVERNLATAKELIGQAVRANAELVVLPENFAFIGQHESDRVTVAETAGDGPQQAFLALAAREFGVWIVGGTIPLRLPESGLVRSASLVFDASGEQVARYDKIHLFDVALPGREERYRESAVTEPGRDISVIDTPCGRLGLAVCYDIRFPELFRAMLEQHMEFCTLPSAFTVPTGKAHWETLVRARAIENQAPIIAAAQGGTHPSGRQTYGDSMIVNAWGEILARLPSGIGVIEAELDRAEQQALRTRFPVLDHRRTDLRY